MGAQRWRIDTGLARDLADALGWRPADGVAALMARVPERVPCGSTAKLDAMTAGAVPPGADVEELARRVVEHQAALTARPAGGAPSPSWSCWVTAPLAAALLVGADIGRVRVAAVRRVDERSPVVDLHAAVLVDDGTSTWLGDPYFGLAAPLPEEPGGVATDETATGTIWLRRNDEGEHDGWEVRVRSTAWLDGLRYTRLAPDLGPGDVQALCAISTTYSGVSFRPYARLHVDGGLLDVRTDDTGAGLVRREERGQAVVDHHPSWTEAADDFATRTGVRITWSGTTVIGA